MFEQLMDGFNFLHRGANITLPDILLALAISFAVGMFIFLVYVKTFKGVMYSRSFAISLLAMNLITTLIILAVSQHLIIAIGMVGALSIVRFRTVIKEPLDLVYLFWSISVGIIVGAGLILIAAVGSAVIGIVLFVFINHKVNDTPYIIVVSCTNESAELKANNVLLEHTKKNMIKAKNVSKEGVELTIEIRLKKNGSTKFINEISEIKGVNSATLVSYNGDYYM